MADKSRNVAAVSTFLRLLEEKDTAAWIELWAEDADHYYPYGTEMFPAHLVGKAAIYERWKDTPGMFESLSFPIRETWVDGDSVLARFDGELVLKDNGGKYRNSYLGIFKFDEAGLIREYWEYFDPITAGTAFGLLDVTYK
ncbi:MAG TPA: nuclear transport factor 2 family protein [Kutzneria sp.]|jgi:ketosteroid isomerase-like protein|nr:nuclear transport factor 2 family protein [Kutzneria sp.]